jgi:hypothetical protein
MDQTQWTKLDSLLQQLIERPLAERGVYARLLAAGDEALEHELRTLAALEAETSSFLERPAIEVAARGLAGDAVPAQADADARIGTVVSHYRVIERIGAGGNGDRLPGRRHSPAAPRGSEVPGR